MTCYMGKLFLDLRPLSSPVEIGANILLAPMDGDATLATCTATAIKKLENGELSCPVSHWLSVVLINPFPNYWISFSFRNRSSMFLGGARFRLKIMGKGNGDNVRENFEWNLFKWNEIRWLPRSVLVNLRRNFRSDGFELKKWNVKRLKSYRMV